jgi:hypothetical protein
VLWAVEVSSHRRAPILLTSISRLLACAVVSITMNVGSMHSVAHNRLRSTRIDFDFAFSYGLKQGPSIESSLVERGIAVNGTNA